MCGLGIASRRKQRRRGTMELLNLPIPTSPLPRLMGPSRGPTTPRVAAVPPPAPQGPFERLGRRLLRPRTPARWALCLLFSHQTRVLEAYRRCESVVGDPMTRAHGLVRRNAARITCNCARRVRRVRTECHRDRQGPAAPERSAGYDAPLGCPGAAPLLPGAPAMCRNSVTEVELHRAVT